MEEIKIFDINGEVRSVSVEALVGLDKAEDGKGLVCELSDGSNGLIPFVVEGKRNPDVDVLLNYVRNKNKVTEEKPVVTEEKEEKVSEKELETPVDAEYEEIPEEIAEEHDGFVGIAENGEVDENLRKKAEEKEFKEKQSFVAKHWKKAAIAALAAGLLFIGFHSCSNEDIKTDTNVPTTIEQISKDSVYTEITEEKLVETAVGFQNVLKENGIEISGQDALRFVTLANISHLQNTNPELLEQVLADVPNSQTLISSAGSVIGKIVTSEITADDKDASYWTMAIIDESDRAIANDGMALIAACKDVVARNKAGEIGYEEATLEIKKLVEEEFVVQNFDNSVAYTIVGEDGKIYYSKDTQTPGANFMTDAIVTGILMGDQDLKDHVNAPGYISVTSKDGQRYDIMSYVSHMSENSSSEIKDDTITPNEATTGDVIEEENKYDFALTQYDPAVYADIIKEYQKENPGFEPTGSELTDQLLVISRNQANVSTLQTTIDGCIESLQNTQEGPVKTK